MIADEAAEAEAEAAEDDDADGHTYCVCDRVSFGEMIGCDGSDCEREWVSFDSLVLWLTIPRDTLADSFLFPLTLISFISLVLDYKQFQKEDGSVMNVEYAFLLS